MLIEIYSPVFKENGETRPPIKLKKGLNVIQGHKKGANSIGKSSALLAIDFAFGGDAYLKSDGVKHIENHTIYYCFEFDKKYYFGRNTKNPDKVIICKKDYSETIDYIKKEEFVSFLMKKYEGNQTNFTFRQLVSTFFRIYGKYNREENYPLQGYRNQPAKESIYILLSLFDFYKDIKPYHEQLELVIDKLKTYKAARKYSFISNLVGGKTKYEENIQTINNLKAELESLTDVTSASITQDDIEKSKYYENLKLIKFELETKIERLQRRQKLLNFSIEFGLMPTEADLQNLTEFFPEVNIKKIFEIENYHKKLSSILNSEFEKEKETLEHEIIELKIRLEAINSELSSNKVKNTFSKEFLDNHTRLQKQIDALQEQNEAFKSEKALTDLKKEAKDILETNIMKFLSDIEFQINTKMYELNATLYEKRRNAPRIVLKSYSNYQLYTPQDSGTGTNFRGLILFDIAMLYLSSLPAIAHDSLLLKNIDDEGIDGIMKLYDDLEKLNKQAFISFDKQSSYSDKTYEILQKNLVLQLISDGQELYGISWNKEGYNETEL